ncbi:DNA and RNA helicase [Solibacillus sp. R5-41]|nr:DNA and RNA helicase [Solibacillus sp. R5-41]
MFANRYPHFLKGRILKREMLENIRDYSRDFLDLYFQDYSNGIIAGVNVVVSETMLVITQGIVKYNNRIYMLLTDHKLPYQATGKELMLKIRFAEEVNELDFTTFTTDIVLDDLMEPTHNELELGRFKLKPGSSLRSAHIDFSDFATEYNTVNYIHCQYAGIHKSTYHPIILQYFAQELLKNRPSNAYDIAFALECLNQDRVQRDVIDFYVSNRLGLEYQEYTNLQIHKYLSRILLETKTGARLTANNQARPKRMIVD